MALSNKTYFTTDFLNFFKELAANNNKNWFEENRKRYELNVKTPFEVFIQETIIALTKYEPLLKDLDYKKCIFRINKDIRFSKDKTPYKLFKSALIAPNGKGNMSSEGIYIEIGPEKVAFYTGFYMPDKDLLLQLRRKIKMDMAGFKNVIEDKQFKSCWGKPKGEKNKIIDKEFKESALKEPLIMNKSLFFISELDGEFATSSDLLPLIIEKYNALNKLKAFFNLK